MIFDNWRSNEGVMQNQDLSEYQRILEARKKKDMADNLQGQINQIKKELAELKTIVTNCCDYCKEKRIAINE
jgi:hypothetical protein